MLQICARLDRGVSPVQGTILRSTVVMLRSEVVVARLIETLTQVSNFVGQKALKFRLRGT